MIRRTALFEDWMITLRDARAKAAVARRIARLRDGNPGDAKSIGEGVSEMRIDYGPGYRVYFTRRGAVVVLLLCGGDKSTQAKDIAKAKELARSWSNDEDEDR
ncbi:MAG TPA: type II toxin-antitoxin system RelE/ParE family toxin [Methylocystis sp.]|nr:type II toxin-antitoxin system RelE/ParE family toxin [Methylocystis sp.]